MADIDFARIIAESGYAWSHDHADVLDAPVAALCPDCSYPSPWQIDYPCSHPNAPTVGRLLRIGEAVWRADHDDDGDVQLANGHVSIDADDLLTALRTVE